MNSSKISPQTLQSLQDLAHNWGKIVARRAAEEHGIGPDADLDTFEQIAQTAAVRLLQGALTELLHQQAQALPKEQNCPQCSRPAPVRTETRTLHFRGAALEYPEPICHCPACRRDFFPSAYDPQVVRAFLQS